MRRIRIGHRAQKDLDRIFRYIAMDNPSAAERTLDRIAKTIRSLETFSTGRRGRLPRTFEKVVVGLPYIVIYKITQSDGGEIANILFVHHASRDFPARDA